MQFTLEGFTGDLQKENCKKLKKKKKQTNGQPYSKINSVSYCSTNAKFSRFNFVPALQYHWKSNSLNPFIFKDSQATHLKP